MVSAKQRTARRAPRTTEMGTVKDRPDESLEQDHSDGRVDRARLGERLDEMIKRLAARRRVPMSQIHFDVGKEVGVKPDAVYKWRSGISLPAAASLERLVEIGVADAGMGREWAEAILVGVFHPEAAAILDRLFVPGRQHEAGARHNLPNRHFRQLVGREGDVTEIMQRLTPRSRDGVVAIEGLGGLGKTALALEVAWRHVEEYTQLQVGRRFDAIVFTSARRQVLDTRGTLVRPPLAVTSRDDILRAIEQVLLDADGVRRSAGERARAVDRALHGAQRVLLIVDALDELAEPQRSEVLAFLHDLPPPHKAIVTARFHEDLSDPLTLTGLPLAAMQELIQQEAQVRRPRLSAAQCDDLAHSSGGVPQVAYWFLGVMALRGLSPAEVATLQDPHNAKVVDYILGDAYKQLGGDLPRALLILYALSLFDDQTGATSEALARAAGLGTEKCLHMLRTLAVLNLATELGDGNEPRYTTVSFVGSLAGSRLDDKQRGAIRTRWIAYYCELVGRELVGCALVGSGSPGTTPESATERGAEGDIIEAEWPNLQRIFEWCATQNDYEMLRRLWLELGLATFAQVRGHWQERQRWLTWLSEAAHDRADAPIEVACLVELARLDTLMGRHEQAEQLLDRASPLQRQAAERIPAELAYRLRVTRMLLRVGQRKLGDARAELDHLEAALARHDDGLGTAERRRHEIVCALVRGRISALLGEDAQAREHFQWILHACSGQPIWARAQAWAQVQLAELDIKSGELARAGELLQAADQTAQQRHDVLLGSWITQTRAALARQQGHTHTARHLAAAAQHEFERLGVRPPDGAVPAAVPVLAAW